MRFAVLGAGAIGGYVGACLARGGLDVTLIARGAHLAALRSHGIRVLSPDGDFRAGPWATEKFVRVLSRPSRATLRRLRALVPAASVLLLSRMMWSGTSASRKTASRWELMA